jgi:hypothetical protein
MKKSGLVLFMLFREEPGLRSTSDPASDFVLHQYQKSRASSRLHEHRQRNPSAAPQCAEHRFLLIPVK